MTPIKAEQIAAIFEVDVSSERRRASETAVSRRDAKAYRKLS